MPNDDRKQEIATPSKAMSFVLMDQTLCAFEIAPILLLEYQSYVFAMLIMLVSFGIHQISKTGRFLAKSDPWLWTHFYVFCPIAYLLMVGVSFIPNHDWKMYPALLVAAALMLPRFALAQKIFKKTYNLPD